MKAAVVWYTADESLPPGTRSHNEISEHGNVREPRRSMFLALPSVGMLWIYPENTDFPGKEIEFF
jgi:hypothetical protein